MSESRLGFGRIQLHILYNVDCIQQTIILQQIKK